MWSNGRDATLPLFRQRWQDNRAMRPRSVSVVVWCAGFALGDDDDALIVLAEWNLRCQPPWLENELRAKLEGARRYGREPVGGLLISSQL